MFQHVSDAAGGAGKVKIQERTEQGPTQAWAVGDGGIDRANRRDPLADEVKGFAQQRGLQAVCHASLDFSADMDGFLAKGCVEGQRLLNRYRRGRMSAYDLYQRNQVRRVEWMADQHTFGMACRSILDFADQDAGGACGYQRVRRRRGIDSRNEIAFDIDPLGTILLNEGGPCDCACEIAFEFQRSPS